jgi:hypothetical protein
MSREITEKVFLKDVANHEMTVLMDNGLYRHLKVKQPGTYNQWFDIVTWPGFLAYTGDMGGFVFTRIPDMFEFFRSNRYPRDGVKLGINPQYWSEKLAAVDRDGRRGGGYQQFSADRLRKHVEEHISTWVEEFRSEHDEDSEEHAVAKKDFETQIREEIRTEVFLYLDDGEYEARRAVNDFQCKIGNDTYNFQDSWEWDCDEYTLRFLWCCYALAWSIQQYDALTVGVK